MNEVLVYILFFFIYVHIFPCIVCFQHDLMRSGVIHHSQATCITVFTCFKGLLFDIQVLIYI